MPATASYGQSFIHPLVNPKPDPNPHAHPGKPFFLRTTAASKFARERRQLYNLMGFTGRQHPSGGFARPTNMLASKLCTRVDVYGFSGNMGGKYWARADKVRGPDWPFGTPRT